MGLRVEGCKTLYYVDSGAPFVLSRQCNTYIYTHKKYTASSLQSNCYVPIAPFALITSTQTAFNFKTP